MATRPFYAASLKIQVIKPVEGSPLRFFAESFIPEHHKVERDTIQELLPEVVRFLSDLVFMAEYEGPRAESREGTVEYRQSQIAPMAERAARGEPLF